MSDNNDIKIITNYVKSSTIKQIDYDPLFEKMIVKFLNEVVYEYYSVPRSEYDELISSPSIGKHFHSKIKNNYEFAKRGEVQKDQTTLLFEQTEE
jgi:hypothetical protein